MPKPPISVSARWHRHWSLSQARGAKTSLGSDRADEASHAIGDLRGWFGNRGSQSTPFALGRGFETGTALTFAVVEGIAGIAGAAGLAALDAGFAVQAWGGG